MSIVIWRFSDAKPGHEQQSNGLVQALQEQVQAGVYNIPVRGSGFWSWLRGVYRPGSELPTPDFLVGAGHATHWHLLAARKRWGGRIILLMKPSLPMSWFDLCIVPEHDQVSPAGNLLSTIGVLNTLRRAEQHDVTQGLIVLGGPSRHYAWDAARILQQITSLLEARPLKRWLLTTSPRTPTLFAQRLASLSAVEYRPYTETKEGWLSDNMMRSGEVWVTEDSVSLVYEALTAGARVGLLAVPRKTPGRVSGGVDRLVARGWVAAPGDWQLATGPPQPLNEARRCADWIKQQWLEAD